MGGRSNLKAGLLTCLSADRPKSAKEIVAATRLDEKNVWDGLSYWWKRGELLRSEKPVFESNKAFKGRRGHRRNTRAYYLYVIKKGDRESASIDGRRYVTLSKGLKDARGTRGGSKAQSVIDYLKEHADIATFSTEIAKALVERGVMARDVMGAVRRARARRYVRVYYSSS